MTRADVSPTTSGSDPDAVCRTDALLERLGQRAPDSRDLDDPVAAALAVLAGDIDLAPVGTEQTRQALLRRGRWPLVEAWDHDLSEEALRPAWAAVTAAANAAAAAIAAPRPVPPAENTLICAAGRSRRTTPSGPRSIPRLDHPRILRMTPVTGLLSAAVLTVLGGGITVLASGADLSAPLHRTTTAAEWRDPGPSGHPDRDRLVARLAQARAALARGDRTQAGAIVDEVRQASGSLPVADRQALTLELDAVQASVASGDPAGIAAGDARIPGQAGGRSEADGEGRGESSSGAVAPEQSVAAAEPPTEPPPADPADPESAGRELPPPSTDPAPTDPAPTGPAPNTSGPAALLPPVVGQEGPVAEPGAATQSTSAAG